MIKRHHDSLPRRLFNLILWWALTLCWAAVIFEFSTATFGTSFTAWLLAQILALFHLQVAPDTFSFLHFLMRKLGHMTEYGIFSLLIYRSLVGSYRTEFRLRRAFWPILLAGLYSLTDEYHQSFVPGRSASIIDCGIDTTAAALAMAALYSVNLLFRSRPHEGATTVSTGNSQSTKNS